ncbi:MAG: aldo/keto reductase [Kofleriaceae bacterium]
MKTRAFGPLASQVPVIGLGTWHMEGDDRTTAIDAIHHAIELGMTHIDTAELYGSGKVESLVGEAITGRRDRVFLVSKVLPSNASFAGTQRACEASLRRLGTDHLDVYLLHWRGDIPLEETIRGFETLRLAGKIRAWGVSNFDDQDLEEALRIAGPGAITCNQVLYHLRERSIEHRVIPWCVKHGVAVVAYSPFGSRNGFPRSPVLEAIAARMHATPRAIALAFLAQRGSAFVIPKSAHPRHIAELAAADRVVLDDRAVAELDAAFATGPWRGLPTL